MAKRYAVTRGCTWCNTCIMECPVDAITMTAEGAQIDQEKCIGCGKCYDSCAFEAIEAIEVDETAPTGA
jgi:uncharacterized Fe-S center protein